MIILTRYENKATVFYWKLEDIVVEPPYELNRFWVVSKFSDDGVGDFEKNFDSASDAKQYIRKYLKSGAIIFEGLGEALEIMDKKERERREAEEMSISSNGNERYQEVGRFPSKSRRGEYYIVKLNSSTGDYTCDCKPWIFNKRGDRTCSHTDKLIGNKREVRYDEVLRAKDRAEDARDRAENARDRAEARWDSRRGRDPRARVTPVSGPAIRPNPRKRKLML